MKSDGVALYEVILERVRLCHDPSAAPDLTGVFDKESLEALAAATGHARQQIVAKEARIQYYCDLLQGFINELLVTRRAQNMLRQATLEKLELGSEEPTVQPPVEAAAEATMKRAISLVGGKLT